MVILGIDYGLKRIGVALSEAGIAQPLEVVKNHADSFRKILRICADNQVEEIVVGLAEGALGEEIKEFVSHLSFLTDLPVVFQDESLTTRDAVAKMIEANKSRKVRQTKKDAFAAACLLQQYLDLDERRRSV